jgi:excinuclease ABC subunit C
MFAFTGRSPYDQGMSLNLKISKLPRSPGVYFMKGQASEVLYVGKAKDLRSRVGSYFTSSKDHSLKTKKLVRLIKDFEVMLVNSEIEALLLERTLIKHHQPPYNILLRDDKEYPYVRIHFGDDWPRLSVVRKRKDDGAEYFGPFSSPSGLRQGLAAVGRVFPLIRCTPWEFDHAKRVCNYFHMKLCLGPCVNPIEKDTYHAMIRNAVGLLQGRSSEVVEELKVRMQRASDNELYEIAAQYRDQLHAISTLHEKQNVVVDPNTDMDALGWSRSEELIAISVVSVRAGKVMGQETFVVTDNGPNDSETTLTHFLLQYYDGRDAPREITLPIDLTVKKDLAVVLRGDTNRSPIMSFQIASDNLQSIATKNAEFKLEEAKQVHDRAKTSLEALQSSLSLPNLPTRIECIDISNLQGTAIVASNVCFIQGQPDKSQYRIYNIETVTDGPDDYTSIYEVTKRRLERGVRDQDLPDLLVIDGGKGQLSSALRARSEFGGMTLPIVSLAKSKVQKIATQKKKLSPAKSFSQDPKHSLERVFISVDQPPIPLAPGSPTYRILTQIRDEAHRFAITKHRKKRSKLATSSPLDAIAGVGPRLKATLLKTFGSLEGINQASIDELTSIRGITADLAYRIKDGIH